MNIVKSLSTYKYLLFLVVYAAIFLCASSSFTTTILKMERLMANMNLKTMKATG